MTDEQLMRRALQLAERGRYSASPNPMVGCVIARDGEPIAEGWHERAGDAHAEVSALANCTDPRGTTMYVTLEPCAHHGRTPPCAEAVVAAGVRKVVVATRDPDERVNGAGLARMRAAGIDVTTGLLEGEARRLNERFIWAASQKLPFVLLKAGMTVDGKLATVTRQSRWISSDEARQKSLLFREEYDAILVGGGTVKTDNPRLTRRLGISRSVTPWTRVVLDGDGEIPPHSLVLSGEARTIVFTPSKAIDGHDELEIVHTDGRIDIERVLGELHARGIRSVIVEGGAVIHSEVIRRSLWQKMVLFVAPMVVGGGDAPSIFSGDAVTRLTDAYRFRFDRAEFAGRDLMITAYPS